MAFLMWYISLLLFSCCLGADLSERKAPQGRFKLALDFGFATATDWQKKGAPRPTNGQLNVVLSTHLNFSRPVSQLFTEPQLWKIARDAMAEVDLELEQYGIGPNKTPGAVTLMAWGNETIIATSLKGQSFTYDSAKTDTAVLQDLKLCQATQPGSNDKHRTGAKCGEEMAAHIYYLLNPEGPPIRELTPQAVIGTVVYQRNVPVGEDNLVQTDPCGTNLPANSPVWGCSRFTGNGEGGQNFRVLDRTLVAAPYTWPPADAAVQISQMQLCGSIFIHP